MKKEDLKIVFMGTPEFAVNSLQALVDGGYNVVGVVTMPDKPIGRHGSVLRSSPVKEYAVSKGLPVLQPEKLKDEEFITALQSWKADLQIVVAFRMLPEVVWNMPRLGTFNLHASLLPQYRGAAPINWAIINGDKETGVSTFFLKHEIDTGSIIKQIHCPIAEKDNAETIHDKLMNLGSGLVTETVDLILSDSIKPIPQSELCSDESQLKSAPKLFRDNTCIDWNQPLVAIYNFIRGLSPYPSAWTSIVSPSGESNTLKIYETEKIEASHSFSIGSLHTDGKNYLDVAVSDGFLRLLVLQLAGKKKMDVKSFLNGNKQIVNYCIK